MASLLANPLARSDMMLLSPLNWSLKADAGCVGESRLKQLLGNLIANCAKYGAARTPITVRLVGSAHEAMIAVENLGSTDVPPKLFEPLLRGGSR